MTSIPLIAGNWKMHGTAEMAAQMLSELKAGSQEISNVQFAVFPPFTYLYECQQQLASTAIGYGAQNVSDKSNGALTGEISTTMLTDLGCQFVLLGHSERRHLLGESDELITKKLIAALSSGLRPILCIGETLEQRESGKTLTIVKEQLAHALRLQDNLPALSSMVIAYEPVWAIGTGKTATPDQVETVHLAIREFCCELLPNIGEQLPILYGGSVKPENAAGLSAMPNVDGALVGGASLKIDQFLEIGKKWKQQ